MASGVVAPLRLLSVNGLAKGGEGGADIGTEMEGAGGESVRERVGGGVEPCVAGDGTSTRYAFWTRLMRSPTWAARSISSTIARAKSA